MKLPKPLGGYVLLEIVTESETPNGLFIPMNSRPVEYLVVQGGEKVSLEVGSSVIFSPNAKTTKVGTTHLLVSMYDIVGVY